MKKKISTILITILALCMCMFTLTACGDKEPPHTHIYDQQVVNDTFKATNATCEDKATYYYSCVCGEKGTDTFEHGEALGHSFTDYAYNEDATCEEDGTETATCDNGCGEKDTRTKADTALAHTFGAPTYIWNNKQCTATRICSRDNNHVETETVTAVYVKDTDATCTTAEKGHYVATFINTAFATQTTATNSVINGEELGHSFTNYTYNNDARCGIDGTETAVCDNGCGESNTRIKSGTALEHEYGAYISNGDGTHTRTCLRNGNHKEHKDCGGGTATCIAYAKCTACGGSYGTLTSHTSKTEWKTTTKHHYHECTTIGCMKKLDYEEHTFDKNKKCTVCEYVTTALLGTEISSDVFTINGTNLYVKVPNNQEIFYFVDTVEVADGATYGFYTNIQGTAYISSYLTDLNDGDNKFYMIVNNNGALPKTYTVVIRRRPMYEVTFNSNGGSAVSKQAVEEDFWATEPTTTRAGYDFDGWDYDFTTPITKNTEINAIWTARDDTPYKVQYYLQNLADDKYALVETEDYVGTTDTKSNITPKTIEHFTLSSSTLSNKINGNGTTVLKLYYTRDKYAITIKSNNAKAGTFTNASGNYKYDKEITLTATTKAGYTFLGWFDGDKCLCENAEYKFNVDKAITITAKWTANTVSYKIEYYLQNLANDDYTLTETTTDSGLTDTTATIEPKDITHFTFNEGYSLNVLESNINGNGSTVLKAYYTRDKYAITVNGNNAKAGTFTNASGNYKYDKEITLTATTNAGYTFLGWFDGETCVCETEEFTFKVEKAVAYVAKFEVKEEMANFNFTSTTTSCSITSIKDKTVTEIIVPDYVTSISSDAFRDCKSLTSVEIPDSVTSIGDWAFYGCSSLESISLPFVGASATATDYQSVFGYIFGYIKSNDSLEISGAIYQYYSSSNSSYPYYHYYIPTSLKTVVITGGSSIGENAFYNCSSLTSIEIPDSVTSIGYKAFYNCSSLTSIEIPDSVTSIGYSAFYYCRSLTSVEIPDSVTSIGDYAFDGCSSLTSIEIPDNVTSIGDRAFSGCSSLESIDVEENNPNYKSIDGNLYSKDGKTLIIYAIGKTATTFTIPNSVESIGSYAFSNCTSLTSIEIPDNVTSIGSYAFSSCDSLTSVEIPDSVESIGDRAFYNCSSLTSIEIPDSVTSIGDSSFSWCTSLTSVEIPDSVTSIGEDAFEYCDSLTSVVIGDNVTSIGDSSFSWCDSLTSVVIGDGVTSIGRYAFSYCKSLTSVEIPDSVTSIGDWAFSDCDSLTSVVIGDSVTSIGYGAFYDCYSLTSVVIGDSVTGIDSSAFSSCSSLKTVYYSGTAEDWSKISISSNNSSLTSATRYYYVENESDVPNLWGEYWHYNAKGEIELWLCDHNYINGICERCGFSNLAFKLNNDRKGYTVTGVGECTDSSIIIPSTYKNKPVTSIGERAFYYCSSLKSVVIPNSVTSIGESAFYNCSKLTSVEIPDSVTSIGYETFSGCTSLTSVVIGDNVTSIGSSAFYECSSLTTIEIPDSVTSSIGGWTFDGCSSLTSVVIGDNVTSIGYRAFWYCSSLTSVTIGNGVTSIDDDAFDCCWSLTKVNYTGTIDQWVQIEFGDYDANPLYYAEKLYINGELVTHANITTSTKINDYAFYSCKSLTSVVIPNSVTRIGDYAFYSCKSLTSIDVEENNPNYKSIDGNLYSKDGKTLIIYAIAKTATTFTIPNGVTSIGEDAFYGCTSLTSIEIPDSVTSIGYEAFRYCYKLVEVINKSAHITIGKGSSSNGYLGYYALAVYNSGDTFTGTKLSNDNGYIVYTQGNEKILVGYSGEGTFLVLPTYITKINSYAFYNCSSLTSVVIGDNVTSIGYEAFRYCYKLVEVINKSAHITIGKGSSSNGYVGYYALAVYNSGDTFTGTKLSNDNGYIVYTQGNEKILVGYSGEETSLVLPTYITKINDYAFYNCSSLTSVTIGNNVTTIGDSAFSGCDSLTSVVIGDSVESIGGSAFSGCSSLTSVVIGDSVTSIGDNAFIHCSSLTSVTIGNNVKDIGEYAFYYCGSLTSVVIGDNVTSIGEGAFSDCSSLTSIKYRGTESQWRAISKGPFWSSYTGKYTITYNYTGE